MLMRSPKPARSTWRTAAGAENGERPPAEAEGADGRFAPTAGCRESGMIGAMKVSAETGAAVQSNRRLRVFLAVQIGVPAVLLLDRLVTGTVEFGGWAWGMYTTVVAG